MTRVTYRDQTAALFRLQPYGWVGTRDLEIAGGRNAWRTRVSDCRLELNMRIDNRQTKHADGAIISEYRYVPTASQPADPEVPTCA